MLQLIWVKKDIVIGNPKNPGAPIHSNEKQFNVKGVNVSTQ
jgi:hypothetical protein